MKANQLTIMNKHTMKHKSKKILALSSFLGLLMTANSAIAAEQNTAKVGNPNSNIITFVCTGNTGRSPMAEYLAHYYFPTNTTNNYTFQSRGTTATNGTPAEANAVTVMNDIHIDLSGHQATLLTTSDVENSKIVLTMTKSHKDQVLAMDPDAKNVYMLSECANGTQTDVVDAYNKPLAIYVYTRNQITGFLQQIYDRGGKCYNSPAKL